MDEMRIERLLSILRQQQLFGLTNDSLTEIISEYDPKDKSELFEDDLDLFVAALGIQRLSFNEYIETILKKKV